MGQITVHTSGWNYAVICERGVLGKAGAAVSALRESTGTFLLSSPRVWKLWGRQLERSFQGAGGCRKVLFDDAERAKTLRTVERLCRELAQGGADRGSIIVALGGGVVGDVAGFVAASYARGLRIVQVPTTLVGQVDSAIGGKTGVNLPEGKNLVGAFHQPRLVLVDPSLLRTLPERQYQAGLYEIVKYGVIRDAGLFRRLEESMGALRKRSPAVLDPVIERCAAIKAEIVSQDEREMRLRMVLNFGHTLGHALEAATRYRRFLHGEAVGWGMIAASQLAAAMGRLDAGEAARIIRLVLKVGRLPSLSGIRWEAVARTMYADKKARGGRLRFVFPKRVGEVEIVDNVPESAVAQVWARLPKMREAMS